MPQIRFAQDGSIYQQNGHLKLLWVLPTPYLKEVCPMSEDSDKIIHGNFLVPILTDNSSMWYLDGHQYIASDCCFYSTSLGGGYRKIINNSYILGGYSFVDYTRTSNENNFFQVSAGGEYISPTWQGHITAYVPVGNTNQSTHMQPPIAGDSQPIVLPQSVTIVEYPYREHAEGGADIQVGRAFSVMPYVLPFVGFYHFGVGNSDTYINGGRVGLEYTHNRWLTLFATDEYDNLHKNAAILGASVTLGGVNPATNPADIDSFMEITPFGYSGIF